MGGRAIADRGVVERAGPRLAGGDEVGDAFVLGLRGEHQRHVRHRRNGGEIPRGLIAGVEDGVGGDRDRHGMGGGWCSRPAPPSRRPPRRPRRRRRGGYSMMRGWPSCDASWSNTAARHEIDGAAGRDRHHHLDRPRRPFLRCGERRAGEGAEKQPQKLSDAGAFRPPSFFSLPEVGEGIDSLQIEHLPQPGTVGGKARSISAARREAAAREPGPARRTARWRRCRAWR